MRSLILAMLLALAVTFDVAAGVRPEQFPSVQGEARSHDVAFSGDDYVLAWSEAGAIVVQRVTLWGQLGPRIEIAASGGDVAVAAAGNVVLVGWTWCETSPLRCGVRLAWIDGTRASEPFEATADLITNDFSRAVALTFDGREFVVAWPRDEARPPLWTAPVPDVPSHIALARLKPFERFVRTDRLPAPSFFGDVQIASTGRADLAGWTRHDSTLGCSVIPMWGPCTVPVPWFTLSSGATRTSEPLARSVRFPEGGLGYTESVVAFDDAFYLAHSGGYTGGPRLVRIGEDGKVSARPWRTTTPRLARDGAKLAVFWMEYGLSGVDHHALVNWIAPPDMSAADQPLSSGGYRLFDTVRTVDPKLAAGNTTMLALYSVYPTPELRRTLAFRMVEQYNPGILPVQATGIQLIDLAGAMKWTARLTWQVSFGLLIQMPEVYHVSAFASDVVSSPLFGGHVPAGAAGPPMAVLEGLAPDTPYRVHVQSENAAGLAAPASFEFRTPAWGTPRAVTDLAVTPRIDGTGVFSWRDMSTAEDGFRIYRQPWQGRPRMLLATVPANTTAATIQLVPGAANYAVVPFNASGEGPAVEVLNVASIGRMRAARK